MLTWEEMQTALKEATELEPHEFERLVSNYVPQGTLDQLLDEYIDYCESAGWSRAMTLRAAGSFMSGIHLGWMLRHKVNS